MFQRPGVSDAFAISAAADPQRDAGGSRDLLHDTGQVSTGSVEAGASFSELADRPVMTGIWQALTRK
jgi:hypothetical protein